jgi:deoxyribose-phosphate aldolase
MQIEAKELNKNALDATSDSIVGLMDFTLLDHNATEMELQSFCNKANVAKPAAVCVFSEQVEAIKVWLDTGIIVAAVCGGFPVGSTDSAQVVSDVECALRGGADEIDIVLEPREEAHSLGPCEENFLKAIRSACGCSVLKVILETPLLKEENIRSTSRLALSTGADFIKSCTGKRGGCSTDAARIMSDELNHFEESTGQKRGIKISGGIQSKEQAVELLSTIIETYPQIVSSSAGLFSREDYARIRIGASSLMKNLIPQLYLDPLPTSCGCTQEALPSQESDTTY